MVSWQREIVWAKAPEGGEREFWPPHVGSPLYKEVSAKSQ